MNRHFTHTRPPRRRRLVYGVPGQNRELKRPRLLSVGSRSFVQPLKSAHIDRSRRARKFRRALKAPGHL